MNDEQKARFLNILVNDVYDLLENEQYQEAKKVASLGTMDLDDYGNIYDFMEYLRTVGTDEATELIFEIEPQFS